MNGVATEVLAVVAELPLSSQVWSSCVKCHLPLGSGTSEWQNYGVSVCMAMGGNLPHFC